MFGFTGNNARKPLRAAMVRKVADQVAADFSAGSSIGWDQEVYDTDNFHDNAVNNTRLTVPPGFTFARCGLTLTIGSDTAGADVTAIVRKNGVTSYDGVAQQTIDAAVAAEPINISTGWVPVIPGDFFEAFLFNVGDITIDITAARSNFWIEVC